MHGETAIDARGGRSEQRKKPSAEVVFAFAPARPTHAQPRDLARCAQRIQGTHACERVERHGAARCARCGQSLSRVSHFCWKKMARCHALSVECRVSERPAEHYQTSPTIGHRRISARCRRSTRGRPPDSISSSSHAKLPDVVRVSYVEASSKPPPPRGSPTRRSVMYYSDAPARVEGVSRQLRFDGLLPLLRE